jgi:hypothetical protein
MKPIKIKMSVINWYHLKNFFIEMIQEKYIGKNILPFEVMVCCEMIIKIDLEKVIDREFMKVKINHSQGFILFTYFSRFKNLGPGMKVILNEVNSQIEEQLFQKTELGFNMLKANSEL